MKICIYRSLLLLGAFVATVSSGCIDGRADDGMRRIIDSLQVISRRAEFLESLELGSAEAVELFRTCAVDESITACRVLIRRGSVEGFATREAIARAHYSLGRILERRGDLNEAKDHYRKAREYDARLSSDAQEVSAPAKIALKPSLSPNEARESINVAAVVGASPPSQRNTIAIDDARSHARHLQQGDTHNLKTGSVAASVCDFPCAH